MNCNDRVIELTSITCNKCNTRFNTEEIKKMIVFEIYWAAYKGTLEWEFSCPHCYSLNFTPKIND